MRTLILIWVGLLSCAVSGLAQHPGQTPSRIHVSSDIRNSEKVADQQAKRQREIAHMNDKIAITYERDALGQIVFTCHNNAFCNYVVELSFPNLQNLRTDVPVPCRMDVPPGTRRMLSLSVITKGESVHFSHRFRYFKGFKSHASIDTGYTYLLPISPGARTSIFEAKYLSAEYSNELEPKGWYGVGFKVHSGDTIFAARRGRVTEAVDDASLPDSNYKFSRKENYVEIAQGDGSFAKYRIFRDSSLFVSPGDWVEAGQPLGIAGGEKYESGPHLQFFVYYHLEPETTDEDPSTRRSSWGYVTTSFWTKGQGSTRLTSQSTYTSEHPAPVITKEMNKKDAKKWMENHKSS